MIQVGDMVRWDDVPVGALVFSDPLTGLRWWYFREGETGNTVGIDRGPGTRADCWACADGSHRPVWVGWSKSDTLVRIVALSLTGNETADEVRRLAGL